MIRFPTRSPRRAHSLRQHRRLRVTPRNLVTRCSYINSAGSWCPPRPAHGCVRRCGDVLRTQSGIDAAPRDPGARIGWTRLHPKLTSDPRYLLLATAPADCRRTLAAVLLPLTTANTFRTFPSCFIARSPTRPRAPAAIPAAKCNERLVLLRPEEN